MRSTSAWLRRLAFRGFNCCCVCALVSWPALTWADRYTLRDGTQLEAELVGEAEGTLYLLTHEGREVTLARAGVAEVASGATLPAELLPKLERTRRTYRELRRRAAKKLLRDLRRAKGEERETLLAALDEFSPELLAGPLGEALEDRKLRELALGRLEAQADGLGVQPLVRAAITSKDKDLREAAHEAALRSDRTRTRTYYEQIVALPTAPRRRLRALGRLAGMGERAAIPGLILALEKVEAEIKTSLATAGGLKSVPLDLGSQSGAARGAPVELPEVELTEVQTKVSVSTLREIAGGITQVLGGLSGVERSGSAAWSEWWDSQPKGLRK